MQKNKKELKKEPYTNPREEVNSGQHNEKEARIRTSISRAYYYVFLVCRQKMERYSGEPEEKDPEIHRVVIENLKSRNAALGHSLENLREKRNLADYNLTQKFNEMEAKKMTTDCRSFINALSGVYPD